ncbi:MAG: hypothetical protein GX606_01460 [Elusimicrobia bacterium]|nr:hypothetical protein [Elusimicrobiota bacterium]
MLQGRKNRGIVLLFALVFMIVMTIMVLGAISRNTSQAISIEKQVQRIQAESVAQGVLWEAYANLQAGAALVDQTVTINGRSFTVDVNRTGADVDIKVDY